MNPELVKDQELHAAPTGPARHPNDISALGLRAGKLVVASRELGMLKEGRFRVWTSSTLIFLVEPSTVPLFHHLMFDAPLSYM